MRISDWSSDVCSSDLLAGKHVQCGKQGGHAIALVIVGHRLVASAFERKARLGEVECLNLGLFIAAQHQRVFRGVEVEADDVFEFLDEVRVVVGIEGFDSLRLEALSAPDAGHRRGWSAERSCREGGGGE